MKNWCKILKYALSITTIANAYFPTPVSASDDELYFYNWQDYISKPLLAKFTKETGIKVIYSTYTSNEMMYSSLKNQKTNYDLVVPSTHFLSKMRKEGMLQKIDKQKLSHFKDLDPAYLNQHFDPENTYSVPYLWGITGIGINADMLHKSSVDSWADLWDPKWEGQLMLMEDPRELFHIALVGLGYSTNTMNPDEIREAYESLTELMPNVLLFSSGAPANLYLSGEISLGVTWNGASYIARKEGVNIEMVWPKEGALLWMDNLSIPANAANADAAHKMIDFLLRPENAAQIAVEVGYPTPVKTAYSLLPDEFKEDKNIYPPQKIIDAAYWLDDVGSAYALYDEYFQKLKAIR